MGLFDRFKKKAEAPVAQEKPAKVSKKSAHAAVNSCFVGRLNLSPSLAYIDMSLFSVLSFMVASFGWLVGWNPIGHR